MPQNGYGVLIMYKISIIIPLYNASVYIIRCLESVASQRYPLLECIIVDDGCSDNSVALVSDYIRNYHEHIDFKMVHHEQNQGLSVARNTGIEHASGDYIFFLDADDELGMDGIAALAEPLQTQALNFVIGKCVLVENGCSRPLEQSYPPFPREKLVKGSDILYSYIRLKWRIHAWNKLVNKDFLLREQLFFKKELRVYEDEPWTFKLACCAQTMGVTHHSCYLYHINPGSLSHRRFFPKLLTYIKLVLSTCEDEVRYFRKEDDYAVINFLEARKRYYIDTLFHNKDSHPLAKRLYYETSHALAAQNFIKQPLNQKVKNFHAVLPKRMGFYYIILLILVQKHTKLKLTKTT
jgi:Glycosyltransferases involved in cell wall biogenesis